MLQRELTRDQAIQAGEQILEELEGQILERGYTYFSNGVVFNTRVENDILLKSDVQGSQVYHVSLNLQNVRKSTCTCPYSRLCKHIAATFFQMYSVFENPRHFLTHSQQPRLLKYADDLLVPPFKNGIQYLTGSHTDTSRDGLLDSSSSVAEWWGFFESWTRNLPSAMESFRASSELISSYENLLGIAILWPKRRASLFAIHATLFYLHLLQEFVQTTRNSHWSLELSQSAERLMSNLEGLLYYWEPDGLNENDQEALIETKRLFEEWKNKDFFSNLDMLAYQLIWWNLLQIPAWIQEESEELEQRIANPTTSPADLEKYRSLHALFLVMVGKDQDALSTWLANERLPLSFYLPFLKSFARVHDWQRLLDWTHRLERLIGTAENSHYRLVTAIWREAMKQMGRESECGKMLQTFLPGSFAEYAAFLFEHQHYREWLDLQLSYRIPFTDIQVWNIKAIEETNPNLLLPLLLFEVNRLIHERNRPAYKEAIKLLKKVRTLYTKIGQEIRWDSYLDQLSAKHNRLRAFQEELRRGNLSV